MFVPFVFNMSTFNEAPFLWWFYMGLDFAKKNNAAIIAQEVYCDTPVSVFAANGRAEAFNKAFVDEHWGYALSKNKDLKDPRTSFWRRSSGGRAPYRTLSAIC